MRGLIVLCVLFVGSSLSQTLTQVYPPPGEGTTFARDGTSGYFYPTTTSRVKLALAGSELSMDDLNELTGEVSIPSGSAFEVGFSLKEDELMRQVAWRIEAVGSGAQVLVCTPSDNGVSEPPCGANGGPIVLKTFKSGFNDFDVSVEFLENSIRSVLRWEGQYFTAEWPQFRGTQGFTLNLNTASITNPIRFQNVRVKTASPVIFLNEFTVGTALPEPFWELLGPPDFNGADYRIVLYDGADNPQYYANNSVTDHFTISGNYGMLRSVFFPAAIRAATTAPAGLGIIKISDGSVLEFFSYGGDGTPLTPTDGPLAGVTAVHLGPNPGENQSWQRTGTGSVAEDFEWVLALPSAENSFNPNAGQTVNALLTDPA